MAWEVPGFRKMRVVTTVTGLLLAWPVLARFKSTVPLVVMPVTVADREGRLVDGLSENDLIVYDNNVPQRIKMDTVIHPISLAVLVQASSNSAAILDKLGGSGILFTELLAAEAGETALLSFSDRAKVVRDFTSDSTQLSGGLKSLRVQGNGVALLDGIRDALRLLATRDNARRRVLLVVAEQRDRSSRVDLASLLRENPLQNTTVYWLTYSAFLASFTNRPKRVWDRMSDEEKADPKRMQPGIKYPWPEEEEPIAPETASGSLINIFTELNHRAAVDVASLLSQTTGGRIFSFLKQSGLESAIHAVAEEVHRQYAVSFQPKPDTPGLYHPLRAEVRGRAELLVRTRAGYWSAQ